MEILQVATFLDARFKSNPFSETETENIKLVILNECTGTNVPVLSQPADACSSSLEPQAKKRKTLGTLFKEHDHEEISPSSSVSSPEQQCKKELECYLSSPRLDFEEDALAWWKNADHKYPSLSSIARKYLCVCATSSASERVFSCSGNIVTPLRASMNPQKVDMLTFLSKNL